MQNRDKLSDAALGLFALLSLGFVSVILLAPTSVKIPVPAADGAAGIGSRAGPLADQISVRGESVASRTATTPPNQGR
jgi:hypothetical protein